MSNYIVIAKIGKSFGIDGYCFVHPFSEGVDSFLSYKKLFIKKNSTDSKNNNSNILETDLSSITIENHLVKQTGKGEKLIVKIKQFPTINAVATICNYDVLIEKTELSKCNDNQYYYYDLEKCTVKNSEELIYGLVEHILTTNISILVVHPNDMSVDKRKRMIPFLFGNTISSVDINNKIIIVNWDADL